MAVDMTNNSSDVFINVGAKADLGGAAEKAMAEFAKMEAKLKTIGTKEAQELARQISAVTKGLGKGTVDPKDVEALTLAFASVQKASELSDKAIADLSAKMSQAVANSRALSDQMRKVEDSAKKSKDANKGLSDAIDDLSPDTKRVTDEMGKWARRIPGVGKLIDGIAAKIPGIGTGFKIVTAAVVETIKVIREMNRGIYDAQQRNMRISEEEARNRKTNALATIEREASARKSLLEDEKAQLLAEREIQRIQDEADLFDRNSAEGYAKQRQFNATQNERKQARADIEAQGEIINKDMAENDKQLEDIEKEKNAKEAYIKAEEKRLAQLEKFVSDNDAMRSEFDKLNEQIANAGGNADASLTERIEQISDGFKAKYADFIKNYDPRNIGKFDTKTASELFKQNDDQARQLRQSLEEARNEVKALDDAQQAASRRGTSLQLSKKRNQEEMARQDKKEKMEDAVTQREIDWNVANRRMEAMGAKNRLTAMGLGSGNAGADSMKDTAKNTHELLNVAKDIKRFMSSGAPALSLGSHAPTESGYRAANWGM